MYKIQIVDSTGTYAFLFESMRNYQNAIAFLKKECHGQSINESSNCFIFRAYSCEALEKMKSFCINHK